MIVRAVINLESADQNRKCVHYIRFFFLWEKLPTKELKVAAHFGQWLVLIDSSGLYY